MWKHFRLSILLCLVVALLSLTPSVALPKNSSVSDKAVHFVMYFFIASVLVFEGSRISTKPAYYLISVVAFCSLYGVLLELGQLVVPGRNFDWWDALYNALGGLIGSLSVTLLLSRFKKL